MGLGEPSREDCQLCPLPSGGAQDARAWKQVLLEWQGRQGSKHYRASTVYWARFHVVFMVPREPAFRFSILLLTKLRVDEVWVLFVWLKKKRQERKEKKILFNFQGLLNQANKRNQLLWRQADTLTLFRLRNSEKECVQRLEHEASLHLVVDWSTQPQIPQQKEDPVYPGYQGGRPLRLPDSNCSGSHPLLIVCNFSPLISACLICLERVVIVVPTS